jgi:hypothetical protein
MAHILPAAGYRRRIGGGDSVPDFMVAGAEGVAMMEDREIGKIWATAKLPLVRQLIEKLVEERASLKCPDTATCYRKNAHIHEALCDFGIDREDFKVGQS